MTIDASGYSWIYSRFTPGVRRAPGSHAAVAVAGAAWSGPEDGSAALGAGDAAHAERLAYTTLKAAAGQSRAFYLFVQNAFPCEKCLTYFKAQPAENYFIFAISEDQGSYSMDNGFAQAALNFPQIVYIGAGTVYYPGYVTFWTHARGADGKRISTRSISLKSCTDPGILKRDGTVKKPPTWPNFPSIRAYL